MRLLTQRQRAPKKEEIGIHKPLNTIRDMQLSQHGSFKSSSDQQKKKSEKLLINHLGLLRRSSSSSKKRSWAA